MTIKKLFVLILIGNLSNSCNMQEQVANAKQSSGKSTGHASSDHKSTTSEKPTSIDNKISIPTTNVPSAPIENSQQIGALVPLTAEEINVTVEENLEAVTEEVTSNENYVLSPAEIQALLAEGAITEEQAQELAALTGGAQ